MTYIREYNLLIVNRAGVIFKANITTLNEAKTLTSVLTKVGVTRYRTTTTIGYRIIAAVLLTIKYHAIREPK